MTLNKEWAGWAALVNQSTQFGKWIKNTITLFGCPDDEQMGNWLYFLLVAGWGGSLPSDFEAEVKALICTAAHPCKLAPSHLPLCTATSTL